MFKRYTFNTFEMKDKLNIHSFSNQIRCYRDINTQEEETIKFGCVHFYYTNF